MNRTEVLSCLNNVLSKCNAYLEEYQKEFEDTERWLDHLRTGASEVANNGVFVIPTTPAGVRKRRRLSVIKECDSGDASSSPSCVVSKTTTVLFSEPLVTTQSVGQSEDVIEEIEDSSENEVSDKPSTKRASSLRHLKPVKIVVKRLSRNSLGKDKLSLNGRPKRITRSARLLKKCSRAETDAVPVCSNEENNGNIREVESDFVESPVYHCQAEKVDDELRKENASENAKHFQGNHSNKNASPSNLNSTCTGGVSESEEYKSHVCKTEKVTMGDLSDHVGKENCVHQTQSGSNILLIPHVHKEQINLGSVECNTDITTDTNANAVGDGKNSNVSSAYYSMVTEESQSEKNSSSYLTAASLHETSHFKLSDRNKITDNHEAISPGQQQNNILKEKIILKKTLRSPVSVMKSPLLFSPFANESVKKRVAAYEGLTASNILKTNKRVTRSKARALFAKEQEVKQMNCKQKSTTQKQIKSVSRGNKKLPVNNDAGKENSFLYSAKKANLSSASKILSDVNVLSTSSQLNSSKKILVTGSKDVFANISSTGMVNKTVYKTGNTVSGNEIWIKKASKIVHDAETLKLEELKKREEKEREVQQRREELLKKRAEKVRKGDEKRLRVMQNREAQDKEKQESKLRVGREKDEKLNILLHEREAKQKEEILKKKLEAERKAAEAKRKIEVTETARVAKLKMDEKLREEAERECKKHAVEEKEKLASKERNNPKPKKGPELALMTCVQKSAIPDYQSDCIFSIPNNDLKPNAMVNGNGNNICNLEDLVSGDSDSEDSDDEREAQIAPWAKRPLIHWHSRLELNIMHQVAKVFASKNTADILAIFPNKRLQRSSSARWDTPPRYSCLPVY